MSFQVDRTDQRDRLRARKKVVKIAKMTFLKLPDKRAKWRIPDKISSGK